ncbi:MAG TPA: IS3 family transposase [Terriglobia bacterium]|nr:IS3 family transposase [Terriglobia bacterium]
MPRQGSLKIERMCRLTGVSRAGYYRWQQEQVPEQEEMEVRSAIQQLALKHRRRYGYRRITAELRRQGMRVNHKRVWRLMRSDNLLAVQPKSFVATTNSKHPLEVYLNLAGRMKLTGINQLWLADITYIRLQREFVYLAVVLDAFSRRVVGWKLERTLMTRLSRSALEKALAERQPPPGLVHHSDRGIQYACAEYVQVLEKHGIIPSMSRPANPYDNASCESFIKTLKREEVNGTAYRDLEHLRSNLEAFLEQYYNHERLHSSLGYVPPAEFEQSIESASSSRGASLSFFRHEEIYRTDGGAGEASRLQASSSSAGKETGSDPQTAPRTIGCDESPAGYSSASCSPAELASASPAVAQSEPREEI